MNKQTWLRFLYLVLSCALLQGCIPVIVAGAGATGASMAGNNLPAKVQLSDSALRMKAVNALNQYPDLAATSNIEITAFNGVILLLGQVPSQQVSEQVAGTIAKIEGVRVVYNQLTIGPRATFTEFSEDSIITTRVKANFIGHVNPLNFKVITEHGVVYLLAVTTEETGAEAAGIASHTLGVKKVVEAYWYIIPDQSSS